MKVFISIVFLFNIVVSKVDFYGNGYIVYDRVSNTVVESKNENYVQSVASISKIMTAIIAIENNELDKEVTVGDEIKKAYGSCVYIHIKDKITIQDLLYAALLRSGNDACLTLATVTFDSQKQFINEMNNLASKLSLTNTHFSNPTGLDESDNGNTSSPRDMAKLMDYCCDNPIFNRIVECKVYKRLDGQGSWHNKNRLLKEYEYCVGGKTGYTKKARRTLVTRAVKNNIDLIIVTFNCGNDFEFHKSKYEECFKKYRNVKLFDSGMVSINDRYYGLNHDIYVNLSSKDLLEIKLTNNYLMIIKNNQLIQQEKLTKYNIYIGMVSIIKDLIYG